LWGVTNDFGESDTSTFDSVLARFDKIRALCRAEVEPGPDPAVDNKTKRKAQAAPKKKAKAKAKAKAQPAARKSSAKRTSNKDVDGVGTIKLTGGEVELTEAEVANPLRRKSGKLVAAESVDDAMQGLAGEAPAEPAASADGAPVLEAEHEETNMMPNAEQGDADTKGGFEGFKDEEPDGAVLPCMPYILAFLKQTNVCCSHRWRGRGEGASPDRAGRG
jgi:hypothetical protein